MDTNLVPINQIAKAAKTDKIHLAYLTKLRLLPQTIRRKVSGKIQGCYPASVVALVHKIEELKDQGLTYSQIRFQLTQPESVLSATPFAVAPAIVQPTSPLALLIVGLLLGYLLATRPPSGAAALTQVPVSPIDINSQTMLKVLKDNGPAQSGPIYVIAVPAQNFSKVGQTNINDLTRVQ